jgi:uncharacterized protein (DUF952 family)
MTNLIYHITSRTAWSAELEQGIYSPDSLISDGFIHCSKMNQLLRVANNYYTNLHGLVILEIDTLQLNPKVRWEAGTDKPNELFPHIYGPLNSDAVVGVIDFEPGVDGKFLLPQSIAAVDHE